MADLSVRSFFPSFVHGSYYCGQFVRFELGPSQHPRPTFNLLTRIVLAPQRCSDALPLRLYIHLALFADALCSMRNKKLRAENLPAAISSPWSHSKNGEKDCLMHCLSLGNPPARACANLSRQPALACYKISIVTRRWQYEYNSLINWQLRIMLKKCLYLQLPFEPKKTGSPPLESNSVLFILQSPCDVFGDICWNTMLKTRA